MCRNERLLALSACLVDEVLTIQCESFPRDLLLHLLLHFSFTSSGRGRETKDIGAGYCSYPTSTVVHSRTSTWAGGRCVEQH